MNVSWCRIWQFRVHTAFWGHIFGHFYAACRPSYIVYTLSDVLGDIMTLQVVLVPWPNHSFLKDPCYATEDTVVYTLGNMKISSNWMSKWTESRVHPGFGGGLKNDLCFGYRIMKFLGFWFFKKIGGFPQPSPPWIRPWTECLFFY